MIALLSWAWWAQKLGSAGVVAAAVTAAVASLAVALTGAVWWIRADAAADERAKWQEAQVRLEKQVGEAKQKAELEAIAVANDILRVRGGDMDAMRHELEQLKTEKADALQRSQAGNSIVIPPGDPWLR